MKSKILVRIVLMLSLVLSARAETTESQQKASSTVVQDFKTAYYWSFYGQYSKDPEVLGDVVSRLSDLTSKIYTVSSEDAYGVFKKEIIAQGGPQMLLSSVGAERVLVGLKLGLMNEVSAFINATHSLNPQLGASLAIMTLGSSGTHLDASVRTFANPMKPGDVDKCLQSCAIYFLGLQNNRYAVDLFAGKAKGPNEYSWQDKEQVFGRFPNAEKENKASFRRGVDPKVAAVSNKCITGCIHEIVTDSVAAVGSAAGVGALFGGPIPAVTLGVAAGVVVGSVAALHCSTSDACGKSRTQELQEQEASRLNAENDLREKKLRSEELQERERARQKQRQAEQDQEKKEQQRQQEEKHKETERRIKDSFEPSKNKEARADSSASCESTRTCDGTMNATIIPDQYRNSETSIGVKTDDRGNFIKGRDRNGKIITSKDLTGLPMPKDSIDDGGSSSNIDANGDVVTKFEMTSTPMPGQEIKSDGSLIDHNGKIVTPRDMTSTPGKILNEGLQTNPKPLNPSIKMSSLPR